MAPATRGCGTPWPLTCTAVVVFPASCDTAFAPPHRPPPRHRPASARDHVARWSDRDQIRDPNPSPSRRRGASTSTAGRETPRCAAAASTEPPLTLGRRRQRPDHLSPPAASCHTWSAMSVAGSIEQVPDRAEEYRYANVRAHRQPGQRPGRCADELGHRQVPPEDRLPPGRTVALLNSDGPSGPVTRGLAEVEIQV